MVPEAAMETSAYLVAVLELTAYSEVVLDVLAHLHSGVVSDTLVVLQLDALDILVVSQLGALDTPAPLAVVLLAVAFAQVRLSYEYFRNCMFWSAYS